LATPERRRPLASRRRYQPFFQFSLQTAFTATAVNEVRFHYGSDSHFDLPAAPPTSPAVTIQDPDTGFVFGGNRRPRDHAQTTSPAHRRIEEDSKDSVAVNFSFISCGDQETRA
jgi:hypothetical protein